MRIQKSILLLLCSILLFSCNTKKNTITNTSTHKEKKVVETIQLSKADSILNKTVNAHGGNLYDTAYYSFVFRGNTYHFKNDGKNYEYLRNIKKEDVVIKDLLKNGEFSRTVNEENITLTDLEIKGGTGALNSVIYFATLPHKLQDASVNKTYVGETIIKGNPYTILGITFEEEGGGNDFDDEFHYWIHTKTNKIDYFAYNYKVNNGGVRFRASYNRRVVDGVTFQDYINYKAPVGTPLSELPKLYEMDKLKELSKIKTENIINLNNK